MDIDQGLVLSTVFTAPPVWAGVIQGIIQVLKSVPQFKTLLEGREKLMCFILAAIVVVLAFYAGMTAVPPERSLDVLGIVVFVSAWFTVARLAMAVYDDLVAKMPEDKPVPKAGERPSQSVLSAKGWNGK